MVIRVVDGGHHWVAASSARSRRRTIISERNIETSWHRGRRGRLGRAIKGGCQITEGDRGRRLADHERVGSGSLVIRVVDGGHHWVAASSARSRRRTIISERNIETSWHRGCRNRFCIAIVSGSQITEGDRGRRLADDERVGSGPLVVGVVDGGHHWEAARGTWSRRRTIISERNIETSWHRGRRDRLGRAIKGGCQITEGDRGRRLADHERVGSGSLEIRVVDGGHHWVAARGTWSGR